MWHHSNVSREKVVIHFFIRRAQRSSIPIICLTVWDFHLSNPKQPLLWIHTKNIIYYIHKKRDKLVCSNKRCCTMNKTYRMLRKYDIQQYQAQVNTVFSPYCVYHIEMAIMLQNECNQTLLYAKTNLLNHQ